MQLPRLSLPHFATGDGAPTGLYVAWTVVLFLVFLVVTFPFDVLVRRALAGLQGGPVRIEFADARFAWHRGIALTGVTVHSDQAPAPLLEADSVALRPLFGQLVRGNPWAVQAHVELYGGTAEVRAHLADGRIAGELDVDDCIGCSCREPDGVHVENIFFESAAPGEYAVWVRNYNAGGNPDPIPYSITVMVNGSPQWLGEGAVVEYASSEPYRFTY